MKNNVSRPFHKHSNHKKKDRAIVVYIKTCPVRWNLQHVAHRGFDVVIFTTQTAVQTPHRPLPKNERF